MSNITRTSLDALSQANFPNNTTQQISPADLRDWIESAVDSFVTQKDTSTFENAFYECKSSNITAVSGTTNLALATGNFVHITGSGPITITSFGTLPAGSRFILNFEIAVTIQYNATQMILPGAANIVTAAGDSAMVVSEGAGNWRLIGYFPAAGLPVGTVTAVTASAPLSSTGGNAPDISITQAGATTDGYLSSADWNTFDGKQDALTLTTSGTSGAATLIGSTLNIPNYATGGGGTPGGAITEVQYNVDNVNFGGIPELTYSGGFVQIETPKIGVGSGNGHLHIHSANSAPTGITNYLTMFWQKATRVLGFRSETDTHESYLQFTAPTADRTYTFPDDTGNVVLDATAQTLSNKTLATPTIDGVATFGNGVNPGEIRLLEGSGSGTNYVGLKAPATLGGNTDYTLPSADGTSGFVLQTNGTGSLSWVQNGGAIGASFLIDSTLTQVTGTTAETLLKSILIPANTFSSNSGFRVQFRIYKPNGGTFQGIYRMYLNTTASLTGSPTLIAQFTQGASGSANSLSMFRSLLIVNQANSTILTGNSLALEPDSQAGAYTNINMSWAVNQYIIISATNNTTGGISQCLSVQVIPQ